MQDPQIGVAGFVCVDILPAFANPPHMTVAELLQPGTLVDTPGITLACGGAVANTGTALARFGARVHFVGRVGDDELGQTIVARLGREGDVTGLRRVAGPSGCTIVLAPRGIDRLFLHCSGANQEFAAGDIAAETLAQIQLLHLGYPTVMPSLYAEEGAELLRVLRRVHAAQVATSLDITLPDPASPAGAADWRTIYRRVLAEVDLFLPSIEEALATALPAEHARLRARIDAAAAAGQALDFVDLVPAELFAAAAEQLLALGVAVVALKAGARGIYLRAAGAGRLARIPGQPLAAAAWADAEWWVAARRVEQVVGTTGAGDVAIAALLVAALRGADPPAALQLANAAGALALGAADATSAVESWAAVQALVQRTVPGEPQLGAAWRAAGAAADGVYQPV